MSLAEECPLEEVVDKFIDYRGKTPTKTTSGIPLITAKIVKGGFIQEPQEFIAEADYDAWMRRGLPEKGDVVLTTEAPLGEVAQISTDKKVALAQRIITLRGKSGVLDNTFLRYSLQSKTMQHRLTGRSSGSTVSGIKSSELKKVLISLPPFEEQQSIANTLSSLDEKIELNRKQNRTLEAIAQALFKHWFVDFEFPDENGRPYKSSGGAMQPSELGEIPVGWEIGKLEHLIGELQTGSRPTGGVGQYKDGIPSIGAESITRVGEYDYGKTKFVPEEYFNKMRRGIIKNRDVLIYKDGGTPGRFDARISMFGDGFPYETACLNEHVFRLQAKKPFYQNYLYLWFSSYPILEELRHRGAKAAIPGINSSDVKGLDFLYMDEGLLKKFDEVVEPLFAKLLLNSKEMCTLANLRDTLLPKLMSGELRVA